MEKLAQIIAYYQRIGAPQDQSALVSLLKEVQEIHGGIPPYALSQIAESLNVKESFLLAIIRRIPSLRLSDSHCLEICAGPNCSKHTALAAFAEKQCGGRFEIKYVPCMRMCGKGPNIKWDGKLYHQADESLLRRLTEEERKP